MIRIRYALRLISAFIGRFKIIILLGVIFGILLFFALKSRLILSLFSGPRRVGVAGRHLPQELPSFILNRISDGLTNIDTSGLPQPSLSSSWETIDNGKTWIFHLSDNYQWHDGSPINSNNIIYEFADLEIDRPDDNSLVFKLNEAFIPFPAVVSKPTFKKGLIGTGDWEVKKLSVAGRFVNEIKIVNIETDEKVIYKFFPTIEKLKLAYKLGEVDEIANLIDSSPFDNWKTSKVVSEVNDWQIVTIFINTQDPLLSDKSVRQALAYAIDDRHFNSEPAFSPISPQSWAFNPQVKKYSFDKERASSLLEEVPNTLKSKPINLISSPILLSTAEEIANNWSSIGIETNIQVSSIVPTDFQAYLTIFDIPKDPDQYALWHSTQPSTNISNYQSPRIDKLLEDGRTTIDYEDRKKIYIDFQRFLLEDLPAIFLYHPTYHTVMRK